MFGFVFFFFLMKTAFSQLEYFNTVLLLLTVAKLCITQRSPGLLNSDEEHVLVKTSPSVCCVTLHGRFISCSNS